MAVGAVAAGCGSTKASTGPAQPRAKAGTLLWRASATTVLAVAEAASTLCVAQGLAGLRGLSATSGQQSWSQSGKQAAYLTLTAIADQAFIVTTGSAVVALDPATGHQKWRFSLPVVTGLPNVPLFATDDTTVYASGMTLSTAIPQYYIFAIDAATGERKWATYFPLTTGISLLTAGNGTVCALGGAAAADMIALDAKTGARTWTAPGPAVPLQGSITAGVISGAVASAGNKSGVVAIDVSNGKTLWTSNVGSNLQDTASGDGIVYASSFNGPARDGVPGELAALDARSGKNLWTRRFPEGAPSNLQPSGGVVYTGFGSTLYILDGQTGDTLWTYKMALTGKDQLSHITPTSSTVYLASLNNTIFAVSA